MRTSTTLFSALGLLVTLLVAGCEPGELGEEGKPGATGPAGSEGAAGEDGPTGPEGPPGASDPETGACIFDNATTSPAQAASVHISGTIAATGGFFFAGGNGDVNGDGDWDADDISLVADYLAGEQAFTAAQFQAADVNGDGLVTGLDLDWITRLIADGLTAEALDLETMRAKSRYEADVIANTRTHGGSGDVNGDGLTNSADTTALVLYLGGDRELTALERARADVNGDGRVDRADLEHIVAKFFRQYDHAAAQRARDNAFFTTHDGYFGLGKRSNGPPPASECSDAQPDGVREGAMALDNANHRLYLCAGSTWHYIAL